MNWGKYYEKKDKKKEKKTRYLSDYLIWYAHISGSDLFKQNLMMKELQGKKISLQNDISILEDIEALNDEIEKDLTL